MHLASNFNIMADECTDVTTIEELSVFCSFVEDWQPVEHFIEIVPMKVTDANTIYSALIKFMIDKNMQTSKLVVWDSMEQLLFLGNTMVTCAASPEDEFTSCCVHILPLPLASTCLCSSN